MMLTPPRPRPSWKEWKTPAEVLAAIDRLLDDHTNDEIAWLLNEQGFVSGGGKRFDGDPSRELSVAVIYNGIVCLGQLE